MKLFSSKRTRAYGKATLAALTLAALHTASCGPAASDIFLAIDNLPGGALLSVWVAPDASRAYIAGGYLGVDPAMVPDRTAAGRLMRYSAGRFETVCRTPNVLWWVYGVGNTIWASGENGHVLRYTEGGMCETLDIGGMYPMGKPTLWGITADSAGGMWFVGGSPLPDGPRGVLLRYDGMTFRQEVIPGAAQMVNLYKIAPDSAGLTVVGANGTVLRRNTSDGMWQPQPVTGLTVTTRCSPSLALRAAPALQSEGREPDRSCFVA